MNSIPIKEAITSGAWYECHARCYQEPIQFRLRVLAFERTSVVQINPQLVRSVTVEGVLWLLSVEVVNLDKAPVGAWRVRHVISLKDAEDFEFPVFAEGT